MWLNKKEAADYLRISTRTITRYANCPDVSLPHSFIGNQMRFHTKDLDSWLKYKKPYKKLMRWQQEEIDIYE